MAPETFDPSRARWDREPTVSQALDSPASEVAGAVPASAVSQTLDARGVWVSLLCCALWAGNSVAIKRAVVDLPPFGCAGLRFLLALPLLYWACRRMAGSVRVDSRYWNLLVINAIMTYGQIGTFTWGLSWTDPGRGTALVNVHPLVVAPLAAWLLGEQLTWRSVVGVCVALSGLLLILWESLVRGTDHLWGDLLILVSAATLGVQIVFQKYCLRTIPAQPYLFWQLALSVPLFLGTSAIAEGVYRYHVTVTGVLALLYQSFVVSGLGFIWWFWLLSRYPATPLAVLGLCTPVLAILFSHLFWGEPLTGHLTAGCALLIVGIYLVIRG
jgi:drug/metabolite transporter (DMT)-like permease